MRELKPLHIVSPLIENKLFEEYTNGQPVYLKLDNNQPSGSFKIRGVGRACTVAAAEGYEELVCPSGGNAGIATAYAARQLNIKAIIVIFNVSSEQVASRIESEGATVVRYGNSSIETIEHAKQLAAERPGKRKFIHPFDCQEVWEGNSTLIDELHQQLNGVQPSLIITCCGGGGLFCGIMRGLEKYNWHSTGVLVMETPGSSSFYAMIQNNYQPATIKCDTLAKTLASAIVCQKAADYTSDKRFNVFSDLVTDLQAMKACLLLADQQRILVELSCGTVLGALYEGYVIQIINSNHNLPQGPVVPIVCGGNDVSLSSMIKWRHSVDDNQITK